MVIYVYIWLIHFVIQQKLTQPPLLYLLNGANNTSAALLGGGIAPSRAASK